MTTSRRSSQNRINFGIVILVMFLVGAGYAVGHRSPYSRSSSASGVTTTYATHRSPCAGPQPNNYVNAKLSDVVWPTGPNQPSHVVIDVPSYKAIGVIVDQWPAACDNPYGTRFRLYVFVSSGPVRNTRQVLPLAKGPPVSSECVARVFEGADGSFGPILCPHGELNALAWVSYAELRAPVLSLGRSASRCQVVVADEEALTSAGPPAEIGLSFPEISDSEQLAHAYYGWRFPDLNPVAGAPKWLATCGSDAVKNWFN